MQFKKVNKEDIPKMRSSNKKLQSMIDEFMDGDADAVELIFSKEDYKDSTAACSSWRCAITRSKRRLKVYQRNGHVYLEKLDHN